MGFIQSFGSRRSPDKDVSVPLRGMGFIGLRVAFSFHLLLFPSPYGAWVLSAKSDISQRLQAQITAKNDVIALIALSYHRISLYTLYHISSRLSIVFRKKKCEYELFRKKSSYSAAGSHPGSCEIVVLNIRKADLKMRAVQRSDKVRHRFGNKND